MLILLCSFLPSYPTFRDIIPYSLDTLTINEVYDPIFLYEKMK